MKYLKMFGLAAVAASALMAFVGASTASATTLEVTTVTTNASVTITASLETGTSSQLNNTSGSIQNTCTESHAHGSTAPPYTVHSSGSLSVEHISGTTNGTVTSEGAEVTVGAPLVGYLTCVTSTPSTDIGTLTGVGHGQATLHINAVVDCGITATWTGTYVITSPDGLGVSA
jgi:hypothetical protein